MIIFLLLVMIATFALLLIVSAFSPKQSKLSHYELERRQKNGDTSAAIATRREKSLIDIVSLQRVAVALLLVMLTMLSIVTFDWLVGSFVAIFIALEYGSIARMHVIQQPARTLYGHLEEPLLHFIERHPRFMRALRHKLLTKPNSMHLESREELQHLITQSQRVLTQDEKNLLTHGLQFADRKVNEVMTPRARIKSIPGKEMLGPLVLDDLHKTGHSRFPVIDKDIDHIIGMLYVHDLLSLDVKQSTTAEKAMASQVYYIRQDQTLQQALMTFLRTHHHLFIVVNEAQETVGIISLEDTIEALIGHKIVDEFDSHTDLRHVARRRL
ncbi:MAG: CBS domain-containing protein [Candidatus Saccharimonadales bacterium]